MEWKPAGDRRAKKGQKEKRLRTEPEREAIAMDPEIPWLKRFEEPQEKPDEDEQIDYEVMLMENEYR